MATNQSETNQTPPPPALTPEGVTLTRPFDVTIIGSGLAGLQCARLLAQGGATVLLVDRKSDLTKGVHTTGISSERPSKISISPWAPSAARSAT